MLGKLDQIYEEMKAVKELADQALVRDLPFGNMNVGCRRRKVSTNNYPRHHHCVLTSENFPKDVDCCASMLELISRAMDFNFLYEKYHQGVVE